MTSIKELFTFSKLIIKNKKINKGGTNENSSK